jgi:hypothetical protein
VHVGYVDTDLTAALDVDKVSPQQVSTAVAKALETGSPEAIADDFSRSIKESLHDDLDLIYPTIEAQFAGSPA